MLNSTKDPSKLLDEIEGALRERKLRLGSHERMVGQYHTPWFKSATEDPKNPYEYAPENTSFDYVAHMLGKLAFRNPEIDVHSRRGDSLGSAVTASYKHGLRQWLTDTRFRDVVEPLAVDYLMPGGFTAMITPTRNPTVYADESWDEEPEWPQIVRISPMDFFRDPLAFSKRESRYEGHRWISDKEDVLDRARKYNDDPDNEWGKWDLEAIESCEGDAGLDDYHENRKRAETLGFAERKSIVCFTIWVPEYTEEGWPGPDEGFHGGEFTLAAHPTAGGLFLRDPKPFFGPRWGPYESCGTYPVPDDPYDLAVLVASEGQVRDFNRHATAITEGSARYKRVVFVGPGVDADLVRNSEHDLVIPTSSMPQGAIEAVEIGGVTAAQIEAYALSKDRAERSLGMSAAKRGNPDGRVSATADAIANDATEIRIDYVQEVWTRAWVRGLTTVAWYMWHSKAMRWPLSPDILDDLGDGKAQRMLGLPAGVPLEVAKQLVSDGEIDLNFEGGDGVHEDAPEGGEAKRTGVRFDDLQIEIAPHSMERISEASRQRKGMLRLEVLMGVVPLMMQAPFIHWGEELERLGDDLGLKDLGKAFDLEAFGELIGYEQQQARELGAAKSGFGGPGSGGARRPALGAGGQQQGSARIMPMESQGSPWGGQSAKRGAQASGSTPKPQQKPMQAIGGAA